MTEENTWISSYKLLRSSVCVLSLLYETRALHTGHSLLV